MINNRVSYQSYISKLTKIIFIVTIIAAAVPYFSPVISIIVTLAALYLMYKAINYKLTMDKDKFVQSNQNNNKTIDYKLEEHENGEYHLVISGDHLKGYDDKALKEVLNFYTMITDKKFTGCIEGRECYTEYRLHFSKDFSTANDNYYKKLEWIEEIKNNPIWKFNLANNRTHENGYEEKTLLRKHLNEIEGIRHKKEIEEGNLIMPSPSTAKELAKMPNTFFEWTSSKIQQCFKKQQTPIMD